MVAVQEWQGGHRKPVAAGPGAVETVELWPRPGLQPDSCSPRRQLVDLCSNFSHCATCCAIWSPCAYDAAAAAAVALADDVAVAAAAAPSTMMVAPNAFCKCSKLYSPRLHVPSLGLCCPLGLLPRILSIFHMSLYGRIYRSMRLIATRFCLFAEDKCNSHSNWTCTFMAFSFSFPLPPIPHPLSHNTPHTRSHFLLCHSHVCSTQSHKKMPKKSVLLMSLCVCVCVGFLPFSGAASAKKFPKYPS